MSLLFFGPSREQLPAPGLWATNLLAPLAGAHAGLSKLQEAAAASDALVRFPLELLLRTLSTPPAALPPRWIKWRIQASSSCVPEPGRGYQFRCPGSLGSVHMTCQWLIRGAAVQTEMLRSDFPENRILK